MKRNKKIDCFFAVRVNGVLNLECCHVSWRWQNP